MKKICFVMPQMPGGGAERVVSILCDYFVQQGYEVLLCLVTKDVIEYTLNKDVIVDTSFLKNKSGLRRIIGRFHDMRNLLKKERNTIFISFNSMINLYLLAANIGIHRRVIVSERNDPSISVVNSKVIFALRRWLYRRSDKVVFQTTLAQEYFDDKIQKKGVIIQNQIKDNLPDCYKGKRETIIVTVARLEKQKNIQMLIQAFSKIHQSYPEYMLYIYGKGPEKAALEKEVELLGLQKSVCFKGFVDNPHDKLRKYKMFVLPSNHEGMSNAMLEAMAIGLPCICTDCPCGGARMVIENGENGLLIETGNQEELYSAMERLITDEKLAIKLSQNAVKIKESLNKEIICKQWENIFNRLDEV